MRKMIGIITGASSGMGREFVLQLDKGLKHVEELWVIARRQEVLEELCGEVSNVRLRVLPLDICNETDLDFLEGLLEAENPDVRLLVNAAGAGTAGNFEEIARADAERMVKLNASALVSLTHIVLPYMGRPSNIIQMASASAFLPQREFAVYAASKTFVLNFSKALAGEIKDRGIAVTVVCPGPVDTEFLALCNKGKEMKLLKKLVMVSPKQVVHKALVDARNKKRLSVYGLPMKCVYILSKFVNLL